MKMSREGLLPLEMVLKKFFEVRLIESIISGLLSTFDGGFL